MNNTTVIVVLAIVSTPLSVSANSYIYPAYGVGMGDVQLALLANNDQSPALKFREQLAQILPDLSVDKRKTQPSLISRIKKRNTDERVIYSVDGNEVREKSIGPDEYIATLMSPIISGQQAQRPIITIRKPRVQTKRMRTAQLKAGTYGRFTELRRPLDSDSYNPPFTILSSEPQRYSSTMIAPKDNAALNPWSVPVSIDLSREKSVASAMHGMLQLVGYRLLMTGPVVDSDAVKSLLSPVAIAQKTMLAPNLKQALVALAGPGLTVVIDHAHRVVSVDTSPRSAMLSKPRI